MYRKEIRLSNGQTSTPFIKFVSKEDAHHHLKAGKSEKTYFAKE